MFDRRAGSFRSRFARDRKTLLARPSAPAPPVTDADLAHLPSLMQTYLRRSGVVGRPRVHNLRVTFDAQMRSSATSPWMPATATQYEFFDPPARLFHMTATRARIPMDVLHEYVDGAATFQVRVAGVVPMVNESGAAITHDETVTLMNDVLVLAPGAVLDLPFSFETADDRTVRATFRNAGFAVGATLTFDADGDLVGFTSADRAHDRKAGAAVWSTPISHYAEVDGIRVGTHGDANWIDETGEWTYGRFVIRSLAYNVEAEHRIARPRATAALGGDLGTVNLYWIPLGAGAHVVRFSGRLFEALSAFVGHRPRTDLYHSALVIDLPEGHFVVEQAPVPDAHGERRGVVAHGPVGVRWAGRFRIFRYEIRRWRGGMIPDIATAVASPVAVSFDPEVARRILDVLPSIPTPVWGRDEFDTGEMWNSNSVIAWALASGGVDVERIALPAGGRAPGWHAGIVVAGGSADPA